jgi:6-phosphogluconate dehydrogenase (decarboxylating)
VVARNVSLQDSTVDASPEWFATGGSVNVSGNTNWIFEDGIGESVHTPVFKHSAKKQWKCTFEGRRSRSI